MGATKYNLLFRRQSTTLKMGMHLHPLGSGTPLVLLLGHTWHLLKTVLNPARSIISHVCLCMERINPLLRCVRLEPNPPDVFAPAHVVIRFQELG